MFLPFTHLMYSCQKVARELLQDSCLTSASCYAVQYDEYTYIFALTVIFAFATAVGIGANDISNSFATSVASRALTLGQIVILGGICEVRIDMLM